MRHTGELLGDIGVAADDTTAVSEYTYDTTMFPVGDSVFIRQLQLAQNVPAFRFCCGLAL